MDKKHSLKKVAKNHYTTEATAFLGGLFQEFKNQTEKYHGLTAQLMRLEAQIELAEKTLCLVRDHLEMTISKTECAIPNDWDKEFRKIRFVGVRLADACRILLQEKNKLTLDQFLAGLNDGMYRFRTNAPLREIHAALIKPTFAVKRGNAYHWIGSPEQQMPLRMRVVTTSEVIDQAPLKNGTTDSQIERKGEKV